MTNDAANVTVDGTVALYSHETEQYVEQAGNKRVCVEYKVATDKALGSVVDQGTAYTTSDVDFTVKVK